MTWSLTELTTRVWSEVGPDPHDVAAKVFEQIPPEQKDAVLRLLLVRYCRETAPTLAKLGARFATHAGKSAKIQSMQQHARDLRDELLGSTVCVGPGRYELLGDCGHEELEYAANLRRAKAQANLAAAVQYETLAELLKKHRVATVRQLPVKALDAFVNTAAVAA